MGRAWLVKVFRRPHAAVYPALGMASEISGIGAILPRILLAYRQNRVVTDAEPCRSSAEGSNPRLIHGQ